MAKALEFFVTYLSGITHDGNLNIPAILVCNTITFMIALLSAIKRIKMLNFVPLFISLIFGGVIKSTIKKHFDTHKSINFKPEKQSLQ